MRGGKTFVYVLGGILLSASVQALIADSFGNPYNRIVERNLFNLKQPAPPPSNVPPPTPPPTITLTSITTILGKKLVTMTVPGKPGQPIQNLMLAEGQGQEGIEILQIDETAGMVRVKNQGIEQTLDFLKNGAKPTLGPAPTFQIPTPIPTQPMPSENMPPANQGSGKFQLPTRNLRMPASPESVPAP